MDLHLHSSWLWMIRAVSTGLFAVIAIAFPPLTSTLAVHLYGAYVNFDGFALIGCNASGHDKRGGMLIAGLLAVASGLAILMWPTSHETMLILTLAVLAVGRGLVEGLSALARTVPAPERQIRLANAVLIMLYGFILTAHEPLKLPTLVTAFAAYAVICAICQFSVGVKLHSRTTHQPPAPRRPTPKPSAQGLRA